MRNIPVLVPEPVHINQHDHLVDIGWCLRKRNIWLVAEEAFEMIVFDTLQIHVSRQEEHDWAAELIAAAVVDEEVHFKKSWEFIGTHQITLESASDLLTLF